MPRKKKMTMAIILSSESQYSSCTKRSRDSQLMPRQDEEERRAHLAISSNVDEVDGDDEEEQEEGRQPVVLGRPVADEDLAREAGREHSLFDEGGGAG